MNGEFIQRFYFPALQHFPPSLMQHYPLCLMQHFPLCLMQHFPPCLMHVSIMSCFLGMTPTTLHLIFGCIVSVDFFTSVPHFGWSTLDPNTPSSPEILATACFATPFNCLDEVYMHLPFAQRIVCFLLYVKYLHCDTATRNTTYIKKIEVFHQLHEYPKMNQRKERN